MPCMMQVKNAWAVTSFVNANNHCSCDRLFKLFPNNLLLWTSIKNRSVSIMYCIWSLILTESARFAWWSFVSKNSSALISLRTGSFLYSRHINIFSFRWHASDFKAIESSMFNQVILFFWLAENCVILVLYHCLFTQFLVVLSLSLKILWWSSSS